MGSSLAVPYMRCAHSSSYCQQFLQHLPRRYILYHSIFLRMLSRWLSHQNSYFTRTGIIVNQRKKLPRDACRVVRPRAVCQAPPRQNSVSSPRNMSWDTALAAPFSSGQVRVRCGMFQRLPRLFRRLLVGVAV